MTLGKEELGLVRAARGELASVYHDAGEHRVVVMCHGFRGNKAGPNRLFVRLARELAERGVSSLRFDQYGSGDSPGDFQESSFDDWVLNIGVIVQNLLKRGSRVSLFGQSMGGAAAIVAASRLGAQLTSLAAWAPDAVCGRVNPKGEWMEEGGQRVDWRYWIEAGKADIAKCFGRISAPAFVVNCADDEMVSEESRAALSALAAANRAVKVYSGYAHSSWTFEQAGAVLRDTIEFLAK